ncbi:MAG: nitroreductase family deazaflavin-dependent oxidoreductase [Novosphingobium sp.]|nr:nitroreductase family deazaflavin-dependent oxidoreductase [Novosphingobium sp.]
MSNGKVTMTAIEQATLDSVARHRDIYVASGGCEGHIRDFSAIGGHAFTTTLLLETIGRRSGERRIAPLIYGTVHGEVLIVASKGGVDVHPGWYCNLAAMDEATIQIGTQAFHATWREPEGDERERLWAFMAAVYPPYTDYRRATERRIPLICFRPGAAVEVLKG